MVFRDCAGTIKLEVDIVRYLEPWMVIEEFEDDVATDIEVVSSFGEDTGDGFIPEEPDVDPFA